MITQRNPLTKCKSKSTSIGRLEVMQQAGINGNIETTTVVSLKAQPVAKIDQNIAIPDHTRRILKIPALNIQIHIAQVKAALKGSSHRSGGGNKFKATVGGVGAAVFKLRFSILEIVKPHLAIQVEPEACLWLKIKESIGIIFVSVKFPVKADFFIT